MSLFWIWRPQEWTAWKIARIVRDSLAPAEQPYIIALAAYSLEYSKEACFTAGMDSFIRKPLIIDPLKFIPRTEVFTFSQAKSGLHGHVNVA
jgi:CheY-like chemotaxis protein